LLLFPINMRKQKQSKTWNMALQQRLCEANGIPMCNTGPSPLSQLYNSSSHQFWLKSCTTQRSSACDHGGIQKRWEGQVHIYNFMLFSVLEDCTLYCSTFKWDAELFTQFYTHGWCRYCYLLQGFSPESLAEKCSSLEKLAVPSLLSWWGLLTEKWYSWAHTHFTLLKQKFQSLTKDYQVIMPLVLLMLLTVSIKYDAVGTPSNSYSFFSLYLILYV
jgi:hypothetical protein